MEIDIQLIPSPPDTEILSKKTVVVIDVLRATSVIVHALSQRVLEVIPVATIEEAFHLARKFPAGSTLLGGERGSCRIEGFDLGNSPREYIAERVGGKRLILTTTNGTKAFRFVSSGGEVMVGSFLNISAIANRCVANGLDIFIFPSGDSGNFSLEDVVCGGMLIDLVLRGDKRSFHLSDASFSAKIIYEYFKDNLSKALYLSNHGKELVERGFGEDIPFCSQTDITSIVPIFKDGRIRGFSDF